MLGQQGGSDASGGADPAGGAAAFEEDGCDRLASGQKQGLSGPTDKGLADVFLVVAAQDLSLALQNSMAIAACQFGCGSWGGQAAQLLRTEGNPAAVFQGLQTGQVGLALPVIAAGETDQAGADQIERRLLHH